MNPHRQPTIDATLRRINSKSNLNQTPSGSGSWADRPESEDEDTDENEVIHNAQLSEQYLRSTGFIHSGDKPNIDNISKTLHVLANYEGIVDNPSNHKAILACAHLVAVLGTPDLADSISREVTKQMEHNITEVKTMLQATMQQFRNDVSEITKKANEQVQQTSHAIQETARTMEKTATSYRDALANKPETSQIPFASNGNIDPSTRAREAVKMRQVLVDVDIEADDAGLQKATYAELVTKANNTIRKINPKTKHEICAVKRLTNGGILLEANSEEAAKWIGHHLDDFTSALSNGAIIRRRTYNMIARFVSVDFDPHSAVQHQEILDRNNIPAESIASVKWIKPTERRAPNQQKAHLAIKFYDQRTANDIAVKGLYILGERINVDKDWKEPLRCFKCQDWDHIALTCTKIRTFCGRCGETGHETKGCNSENLCCLPCGQRGHASGDRRQCPAFKAKREAMNARIPENAMPYFPTEEP